ncbi:MAG TPA: ABC transporter ATP-binding protein [Desulfobacterales bacterium]|nr:ABC transporter ATP-binding protein [Desulfobacterales bacterium]
MTTTSPIIDLKGVSFGYPGGPLILRELDFTLLPEDRVGIIAPNGSGKTTLFLLIMGLLKPLSGRMQIFGKEVREEKGFTEVRRRIGLLFQDADDQLFSPTVLEDVAFGPLNLGKSKAEALAIARQTLDFLGLKGFEDRITFKLSGGEKRLVALATVLAMEPEVLLLDEPVNGLDTRTRTRLMEILHQLTIPFVLISHELDFLTATTMTIYTMADGRIRLDQELTLHQHVHAHPLGASPHEHSPTGAAPGDSSAHAVDKPC